MKREVLGWIMLGWPVAIIVGIVVVTAVQEAWTHEGWRGIGGMLLMLAAIGSFGWGLWLVMHGHALGR